MPPLTHQNFHVIFMMDIFASTARGGIYPVLFLETSKIWGARHEHWGPGCQHMARFTQVVQFYKLYRGHSIVQAQDPQTNPRWGFQYNKEENEPSILRTFSVLPTRIERSDM